MWWAMSWVLLFIYLTLLVVCGIDTIRKGRWLLFIVGIVFPLLWIIGALLPPTRRAQEAGVV